MSLDWDTTAITDPEVNFPPDEQGRMNDDLHVLIWLTIPTGMHSITDKNVEEFWRRVDIWQNVIGSGFTTVKTGDPGDFPPGTSEADRTTVTPYKVRKRSALNAVGLRTNANPKTRAAFLKDLFAAHERTFEVDR